MAFVRVTFNWIQPVALKANGNTITATLISKQALPSTIWNDDLGIDWNVSMNNQLTWTDVGTTGNHIYVTGAAPKDRYETAIAVGCIAADGDTPRADNSTILNNIFAKFSTLAIGHVVNGIEVGTPNPAAMTYWSPNWSGANPFATNAAYRTAMGLLQYSDARCDGWAHFFLDTVQDQGVTTSKILTITPKVVKKPPARPGMKFVNEQLFVNASANAQGVSPASRHEFNEHVVVLDTTPGIGGAKNYALFDPSYGIMETGSGKAVDAAVGIQWEQAAGAGIELGYLPNPIPPRTRPVETYFPLQPAPAPPVCDYDPAR